MTRTLLLTLALLAAPAALRADEAADRNAEARTLVSKTLIRNLETGFRSAVDKTVAAMPEARAATVRKDLDAEFDRQRGIMVDGLSKIYAERFTLPELKHLGAIYDDPVYQRFQAIVADPASPATAVSQALVTKLLNMLAVAATSETQVPPAAPPPGGAPQTAPPAR